ncbi:MAG: polysaccharide pyruvyl transferase family protein [Clostridia bacterium]|nr:polysaccharide pyruvyl transferase family protein [Clostridia bacterium]
MQNKIGIVTMYHNSINYGGVLQAYALTRVLNDNGYDAEQIRVVGKMTERQKLCILFNFGVKRAIRQVWRNAKWIFKQPIKRILKRQSIAVVAHNSLDTSFEHFRNDYVPHSQEIYNGNNVNKTNHKYDIFITGSDQVWNFSWYNPIYFLDFAKKHKKKISYAASISMDSLSDKQRRVFRKSLRSYNAVSVREEESIALISDLSPVDPKIVLDPTLLLSRDKWNTLATKETVSDEYAFCYFIGDNKASRRVAKEFAQKMGLKLIGISHYDKYDGFDIELSTAGPEEFLSYLKNAKYIFTDSFHAVVFSKIFEKQYFVFNRDNKGSMSSRIRTITSLFETEERFCYGERENLGYIESLSDIDYTKSLLKFEEKKKESIEFLLGALENK